MSYEQTSDPYDTIVYITDRIAGRGFQGSGVIIAPDEVLTASHVVHDSDLGAADYITVSPAYGSQPSGASPKPGSARNGSMGRGPPATPA